MNPSTKFNILQPSFGHANNRLIPNSIDNLKAEASPLQRSTVRKSFKRKLPQQNLPVRDTKPECKSPVSTHQSSPFVDIPSSAGRVGTKNSLGPHPPASVARRNARERNRVKQVNTGFAVLRQHIPVLCGSVIVYGGLPNSSESSSSSSSCSSSSSSSPPASNASSRCKKNKMSKVETLRCAVEYIRNLEKLLATGGDGKTGQDLPIKDEPLDCLSYELDVAVGSPSIQESRENISPFEMGGLSTSANDLSGFYDSSSSPESQSPDVHNHQNQRFLFPFMMDTSPTTLPPNGEQKRIKTEPDSAALFKQELLRSLSCWNRSDQEQQPLPELLMDHPGQAEQQQNSAMQNISDHSLLESLNSWWASSL